MDRAASVGVIRRVTQPRMTAAAFYCTSETLPFRNVTFTSL
jgi:hypothetical protein